MYYQQFNNKITASMLSYVDGNIRALNDAAYYYGNIMAVRILMMTILKLLLANYWQVAISKLSHREGIKLSTNEDSVAAILVATCLAMHT